MSDAVVRSFPESAEKALALEYVKSHTTESMTIEEIAKMYHDSIWAFKDALAKIQKNDPRSKARIG